MKKFLFLASIVMLGVLFSSCGDKKVFKCIPDTADVVVVVSPDKNFSEMVDKKALEEVFDEVGMRGSERDLMMKFVEDPKSMGLNLSKKMAAWMEVDKNVDPRRGGVVIRVSKADALRNAIQDMKDKDFFEFSEIIQQDGFSYVYPFKDDKEAILGWNNDVMLLLFSDRDNLTASDLNTAFTRDKNTSVLANKDFNDFKKNLKNINVWVKSDKFFAEVDDVPEVKEFKESANLDFKDNYLHFHLTVNKKELNMEVKVNRNESMQNVDQMKLLNAYKKLREMERKRYSRYYEDYNY